MFETDTTKADLADLAFRKRLITRTRHLFFCRCFFPVNNTPITPGAIRILSIAHLYDVRLSGLREIRATASHAPRKTFHAPRKTRLITLSPCIPAYSLVDPYAWTTPPQPIHIRTSLYIMRLLAPISTVLLGLMPFVASLPVLTSQQDASQSKEQNPNYTPWLIFSMREQPFEEASLSFTILDQDTRYTVACKSTLPMSGYVDCEDGKTSFVYGGVSFQFGETWLSIKRDDIKDCPAGGKSPCTSRTAVGHLTLPNNFWQQPGWNSWVHPESLDVHWSWA